MTCPSDRRARLLDGIFLLLVGFGPALLYVPDLGFYSDDWSFLTQMAVLPGDSLLMHIQRMLPETELRPGQAVYSALVYSLFGLVPAGVHCGAGVLIVGTFGAFWEEAYRRETAIVDDIQRVVPRLPAGSTLLLDGECAYHGPAVVFESSWDLEGRLRMLYQDSTVRADIVSARLEVEETEVWTWLNVPADHVSYPYADGILVYNRRHDVLVPIRDAGEMTQYLERYNQTRDNGCPFGWPGNGVTILPRPVQ